VHRERGVDLDGDVVIGALDFQGDWRVVVGYARDEAVHRDVQMLARGSAVGDEAVG
jgi:hypothetical protein